MPAVLAISLLVAAPTAFGQASSALVSRHKTLRAFADDYWDFYQRENPESASFYGEYRYNDKLRDFSLAHWHRAEKDTALLLARAAALDVSGLPARDQLDKLLLVRTLSDKLEGLRLKTYEMPVDQFGGIQIALPQLVSSVPLDTVRHFQDYIARLNQVPKLFDQVIAVMRQGEKDGLMPPRYLLDMTVRQAQAIERPKGAANVFAEPAQRIPVTFSAADRKRLRMEIVRAVDTKVRPAYVKLEKFIATEYAPNGRPEAGLWSLPNGDALYRFAIHMQTTSDLSPEQIHQLGLAQVADIEGQIAALAKAAGFADAKTFKASVHADPKLVPTSRQQILDQYQRYIAQMQPRLPQLFGLLPKADVIVKSLPAYMEKEGSTEYHQGTADGSRGGEVWVKTYDFKHQSMLENESTAYHEGIPGHHMQISIAQELPDIHPFHRALTEDYNAYIEGWALYAERLGKEVGFYQDPASDLGRLESEQLRAIRLVVDTGVHYKHWTRQQMIDYFNQYLGEAMESEVDRYIADPAQALGYKIGQLKILALRRHAQDQLGSTFDVRAFHDEILNAGPLPLDVLESRVNAWVASLSSAPVTVVVRRDGD
jgi:uncharacterized protein (DUF885 family)